MGNNTNRAKAAFGAKVLKMTGKIAVPLAAFYLAIGAPGCERNSAKTLGVGNEKKHELYAPYERSRAKAVDTGAQYRDSQKTVDLMMESLETPYNVEVTPVGRQKK